MHYKTLNLKLKKVGTTAISFAACLTVGIVSCWLYDYVIIKGRHRNLTVFDDRLGGISPQDSHPNKSEATLAGRTSLVDLESRIAEIDNWLQNDARSELIQATFSDFAKTDGPVMAIREAFRLFDRPGLPSLQRELETEIATISALAVALPSDQQLALLLSEAPDWGRHSLLRSIGLFSSPRNAIGIYTHLKHLLYLGDSNQNRELQLLIYEIAVKAAPSCTRETLNSLVTNLPGTVENDAIVATIAKAAAARNVTLAIEFLLTASKDAPSELADFAFSIHLSPQSLKVLLNKLTSDQRQGFVSSYIQRISDGNPQHYLELAESIKAEDLPEHLRSRLLMGLLQTSGGVAVGWLQSIPKTERGDAMDSTYDTICKHPIALNIFSKSWLEAAAMCQGVDDEKFVAALINASGSLDWSTARRYSELLPEKANVKLESALYTGQTYKLALGDPATLQSFLESAPEEHRRTLLAIAAQTMAINTPDRILEWHDATSDFATKKLLEEIMMSNTNLPAVPVEIRREWLTQRISDPDYWKNPSSAVNRYVLDLMDSDGAAAVNFTMTLPASPMKDAALEELAREWAFNDPVSASQWIVEMPPGQSRNIALSELIKASRDEPETAFLNVVGIDDPTMRFQTAAAVVAWWKTRDTKRIMQLINESRLPPEEKTKLGMALQK